MLRQGQRDLSNPLSLLNSDLLKHIVYSAMGFHHLEHIDMGSGMAAAGVVDTSWGRGRGRCGGGVGGWARGRGRGRGRGGGGVDGGGHVAGQPQPLFWQAFLAGLAQ